MLITFYITNGGAVALIQIRYLMTHGLKPYHTDLLADLVTTQQTSLYLHEKTHLYVQFKSAIVNTV